MYLHEMRERKFKRRAIEQVPIPERDERLAEAMEKYLTSRGLSYEVARFNVWYPSHQAGDCHPRIVIPASRKDGGTFWQARAMDPEVEKRFMSPLWGRAMHW